MKRVCYTVFYPHMKNVDIIKESGMMAHYLCQTEKYEVALAAYKGEEFTNIQLIDSRVSNDYIKRRTGYTLPDSLLYLFTRAKKIDVLQLFHLNKMSVIIAAAYKLLNPQGLVYIKLDTSERHLQHLLISSGLKGRIREFVLAHIVDLVSAETKNVYDKVRQNWGQLANKLIYLPNGIKPVNSESTQKEKIILTVGRIGSYEKATDVLLNALTKCRLKDWTVQMVGPIEPEFNNSIEKWFKENPHLKEKVIFTGPVWDRQELSRYYDKAAVFCLPSRWENFSFALLEAASHGCYLILTPVGAARELLEITQYGELVNADDEQRLSQALNDIVDSWKYDHSKDSLIRSTVNDLFNWENIIKSLDEHLSSRLRNKGCHNEN
ncbi:MAG TPA: glycosyltransferase family 4 protein [Selenomonadales bacterium]|nr:glycosyltransferase family 4 protein [Selenomonadales bacterium]